MLWAEYKKVDLDLTAGGVILNSRPYVDGTDSLNDNRIFVRFFNSETPWPLSTNEYTTNLAARNRLNSAMFTLPDTPEQIAEELKLTKASQKDRVNTVIDRKVNQHYQDFPGGAHASETMRAEAFSVRDGGNLMGISVAIDDLALRLRGSPVTDNKAEAMADKVITDTDGDEAFNTAVYNIKDEVYKAINAEEDFTPMLDELKAL